jgi:ATP-dependent HslUV protease ATP-binding subunit HslU
LFCVFYSKCCACVLLLILFGHYIYMLTHSLTLTHTHTLTHSHTHPHTHTGPTGCGKTEIARRLAKLANAPFIKVEATKFTEVGFQGRDVDQIVRDLVRVSLNMHKQQRKLKIKNEVQSGVEERILNYLIGSKNDSPLDRGSYLEHLRAGRLEEQTIEVDLPPPEASTGGSGGLGGRISHADLFEGAKLIGFGDSKGEKKRMTVAEARGQIEEMETNRMTSEEDLKADAIKSVEQDGIVFLDEIDKIVSARNASSSSPDASAEGVQRDLLPLVEGTNVSTKYGNVNTKNVLFIASGAFSAVKPSDMLAELQGRLPIRVELTALTEEDLYQVITKTENNLIRQQVEMLATEGVTLEFTEEALREIARVAADVNATAQNIGARRLHTVIERIVEDVSFDAPDLEKGSTFTVDLEYLRTKVTDMQLKTDLSKYML